MQNFGIAIEAAAIMDKLALQLWITEAILLAKETGSPASAVATIFTLTGEQLAERIIAREHPTEISARGLRKHLRGRPARIAPHN
jgi:hypothetical protein